MAMAPVGVMKAWFTGAVFVSAVAGCGAARYTLTGKNVGTRLAIANCFAAGVMYSLAFLHLLPSGQHALDPLSPFPWANMLCCLGTGIALFLEKVLVGSHQAVAEHISMTPAELPDDFMSYNMTLPAPMSIDPQREPQPPAMPRPDARQQPQSAESVALASAAGRGRSGASYSSTGEAIPAAQRVTPLGCITDVESPCDIHDSKSCPASSSRVWTDSPCGRDTHHHHVPYTTAQYREGLRAGIAVAEHMLRDGCGRPPNSELPPCPYKRPESAKRVRITFEEEQGVKWMSLDLLLVIGVHSLIEGMALGAAGTGDVWAVALAILSHKALAGMALGIGWIRDSLPPRHYALFTFVFAALSPIGSLLGAGIQSMLKGTSGRIFSGACQAAGAGTFVYIGLIEFFEAELTRAPCAGIRSVRMQNFAAFSVGFTGMAFIAIWV